MWLAHLIELYGREIAILIYKFKIMVWLKAKRISVWTWKATRALHGIVKVNSKYNVFDILENKYKYFLNRANTFFNFIILLIEGILTHSSPITFNYFKN